MFWRQCPGTSIEPVLWWIISKWNTCHGLSLLISRRLIAVDVVGFHALLSSWAQSRLKSPASRLSTQLLIQAQIKENIKAPRNWPLWGEFTGDRWNPRTNGQWRRKCFNWMTSPCTHVTYCQLYHWQNTCTLKRWNSNRNVIKFGSKYNTFSKEILAMKMPSTKWQYFSSPFFRLIFTKSIQILYCSSYYITFERGRFWSIFNFIFYSH